MATLNETTTPLCNEYVDTLAARFGKRVDGSEVAALKSKLLELQNCGVDKYDLVKAATTHAILCWGSTVSMNVCPW